MRNRSLVSWIPLLAIALACESPLDQPGNRCAGEYSFEQIDAWFHEIGSETISLEGVVLIDANEVTNCLDIGVLRYDVVPALESQLAELGIPRDAVFFFITPPPENRSHG